MTPDASPLRYTLHIAAMYPFASRPGHFRRQAVRGPFATEAEAVAAALAYRGNPAGEVCFIGVYAFRVDARGVAHSERYTLTSSSHAELNALVAPRYRVRLA